MRCDEEDIEYILFHLKQPERIGEMEFQQWVQQEEHRELFDEVRNYREAFLYRAYSQKIDVDGEYRQFMAKTVPVRHLSWIKWAACLAGICILSIWLIRTTPSSLPASVQSEIPVGKKTAELILADGKRVNLDNRHMEFREENRICIVNDTNCELAYRRDSVTAASSAAGLIYHTLRVPAGADYVVCLSDGTKVRLNSETNLRFPVEFAGEERKVFLEGEAFFEVEKAQEWPFVVETERMNVQVTGTRFNVKSYRSEDLVHTTLVSGAVKIYPDKKIAAPVELFPSQQFRLDKRTGQTEVKTVDVGLYTDWIEGRFVFKDQRLEEVMNTLARWYSVEVFYATPSVKDWRLSANLGRYEHIDAILQMIQAIDKVEIVRKGNTITISWK